MLLGSGSHDLDYAAVLKGGVQPNVKIADKDRYQGLNLNFTLKRGQKSFCSDKIIDYLIIKTGSCPSSAAYLFGYVWSLMLLRSSDSWINLRPPLVLPVPRPFFFYLLNLS